MKESQLITKIKVHLKNKYGIVCFKHYAHPAFSEKGVADIIGCIPPSGRMICLEVKIPPNKPTPLQYAWLQRYVDAGAIAWWVCSIVDVDNLMKKVIHRGLLDTIIV